MDEKFEVRKISYKNAFGNGGSSPAFQCPNCYGTCAHYWDYALKSEVTLVSQNMLQSLSRWIIHAKCQGCSGSSYWLKSEDEEFVLFPRSVVDLPKPNSDMPSSIKQIYNEAALVLENSPRASAALSRLAIDLLTKELEPSGKDLNKRIGILVENGLSTRIQKGLDSIRVIGNNAVHPGEIDITDNKDIALSLLKFLNIIVDNQITQPKEIDDIYSSLPTGALEAIEKRDSK